MRTICGLLAVLMIFGTIGMGMMFIVDAPNQGNDSQITSTDFSSSEAHGTRATPSEGPTFVNLYFHSSGSSMNTTLWDGAVDTAGDISFTLQDPLAKNLWVEDPPGQPGLMAGVYLAGGDQLVTVTVWDNDAGNVIGTGTHGPFTYGASPQYVEIPIPFDTGHNYTFSQGHSIGISFDFDFGTGILHYDYSPFESFLRVYCLPVLDVTMEFSNFDDEPTTLFFPNNINFPDNRREVKIKGIVSDAFGKRDYKYIDYVALQFKDPSGDEFPKNSTWKGEDSEYTYTWDYSAGQEDGEYRVTARVLDEQDNQFTVSGTFNMSEYGVLLTSPSQDPEEGAYKSQAKRNVIQTNVTRYTINCWNTGNTPTGVNITTNGQAGWNWWLEGENLETENLQTGVIATIPTGSHSDFVLAVDSLDNPLHAKSTITITVASTGDGTKDDFLTCITTVVVKYNVEMEFLDHTKSYSQNADMGMDVIYDFTVANEGGEDDNIKIELGLPPSGWTMSLDGDELQKNTPIGQYSVFLSSDDSTQLTLTLGTPSSGGDETVVIPIIGSSHGSYQQGDDPVVSDEITATTILTTGVKLEVNGARHRETDPDDDVNYELELTNTGATAGNFTVSFTPPGLSTGWSSGDISFDSSVPMSTKSFSNLAPNNPKTFFLYMEPTLDVLADNYTIVIRAENNQNPTERFEEESVSCEVNEFYNMELIEPVPAVLEDKAKPGDDVEYVIRIENNGNVREKVTVSVDKPSEWKLDFGNASTIWTKDIEPGDRETINVVLTVPDDAQGDETVDIPITIVPVQSDTIIVETHTKIEGSLTQTLYTLLIPILLFVCVIIPMTIYIYKRR